MPRRSGATLESVGLEALVQLGMPALGGLSHVLLRDLDPAGDHSRDEHFEFDYLVPYGEIGLVGEITERNAEHIEQKFTKFRRAVNTLQHLLPIDNAAWRRIGVPGSRLADFRRIARLRAFFIATNVEEFDKKLGGRQLQNAAVFYRPDWRLLLSYAKTLGTYGRPYLEAKLGIAPVTGRLSLRLTHDDHSLIVAHDRRVAMGGVGSANVYTFEVSPYELLPFAQVFRRDLLPDLSARSDKDYQRPLLSEKLAQIRRKLRDTADFVFPSNILVTLANDCRYDSHNKVLVIPGRYGAVQVIDGQHRLFSYADSAVESRRRQDARIMVTGIQFDDPDEARTTRYSAKTFVEINSNQTRITASHLDAIAFDVLGETTPAALAAVVLLRLNTAGSRVKGLFKTSQTALGVISPATVAKAIRPLVSIESIRSLTVQTDSVRLRGLHNLLGDTQHGLRRPRTLINRAVAALDQYFNRLASTFQHDFPSRDVERASAFEYAKVFSGFVMLFDQFIAEGLTWSEVQRQLNNIRRNVLALRNQPEYAGVLFDGEDARIPDSGPTVQDDYKFLDANRYTPTAIQDVVTQRRRPHRRPGRRRR